jgi:hypothetical protein
LNTLHITINGEPAHGAQAEAHFVEWALALEQEHNEKLLAACKGERTSLAAINVFQFAAFSPFRTTADCNLLGQAGIEIKPVVHFQGNVDFYQVPLIDTGETCEVAYLFALDHPRLGCRPVRTSRVLKMNDDGSFETLNTIYKPAPEVEHLPADDTEGGAA